MQTPASAGLTDSDAPACTSACTGDPENVHERGSDVAPDGAADDAVDEQLAAVADAWARLPEAVRAGIVAMVRVAVE